MDLIEIIHKIIQENVEAQKPTDLIIGTVVSASPLSVQINANQPPLPEQVLVVCEEVTRHKVELYDSNDEHQAGTYWVHAELKTGDKVIMLRCMKGQTYIILSRVGG